MKKMMKCLVLALAVLTIAGSAWSWDFADHVKMAPNGQGDMLLYPFYAAFNGGWETKISVVNTAPNRSVIAHIVFYSAKNSIELLDFFLFLTPTDVWTGTVKVGSDGIARLYSTDDSAMVSAGSFATKDNPIDVQLRDPLTVGGSTCVSTAERWGTNIGYMKVLELAHSTAVAASTAYIPGGTYGTQVFNLSRAGLDKGVLYAAFNHFMALQNGTAVAAGTTINPLAMDGINVLAGNMEFRNSVTGQGAIIPATAMRDYDNQLPVGLTQSIGFSAGCGYAGGAGVTAASPVMTALGNINAGCQVGGGPLTDTWYAGVANPPAGTTYTCNPPTAAAGRAATSATCRCVADPTVVGNKGPIRGAVGCQTNSIGEVEAALAKDWLEMPINTKTGTVHILTFPTKQTNTAVGVGSGSTTDCYFVSTPSPFFNEVLPTNRVTMPPINRPSSYSSAWENWGCLSYASTDYDLTEKSSATTGIFSPAAKPQSLCGEMNLRAGDFSFDEGWVVYNFSPNTSAAGMGTAVYTTRFNMQANLGPQAVAGTCGVAGQPPCFDAQYTGAPVIATSLYIGGNGLSLAPSSWADGEVRYLGANGTTGTVANSADDVVYHYYQYWDFANTNGVQPVGVAGTVAHYGADDTGCINGGVVVPCGVASIAGGGAGNIYGNRFSGDRLTAVILANVPTTVNAAMAANMTRVFVPTGTTIVTDTALPAMVTAPYNGTAIAVGTTIVAADTFVTIPVATTLTSSVDLFGNDGNMP